MSKHPRLVRDHVLSEEQWKQADADLEKALAAEAKKATFSASEPKGEEKKPETNDGT